MKKNVFLCSLFLMCSFLTGCVNTVDSASTEEMEVINENLRLKDKIAELENDIDERNQKEILEREVERIILGFFLDISNGHIDEAESQTTENIKVTSTSIVANSSRIEIDYPHSQYLLQPIQAKWESDQEVCFMFDIIQEKGDYSFKIYIVNEDNEWKIDNLMMVYS